MPKQFEKLKIGPNPKLLPQFYGPFKILKRVDKATYNLNLPSTSKVHHAFHVSCLRKQLYSQDNVVVEGILVELIAPPINHMSLRGFWIVMSFEFVVIIVAKF